MRIAFVDLTFSWPPVGGAQVDLYHTIAGLQRAGHDVHLFAPALSGRWRQAAIQPEQLPFPATAVELASRQETGRAVAERFHAEAAPWKPNLVFIGLARHSKPHVIHAFAEYPVISRYYMYEHLCIRDATLYKYDRLCLNDFLRTPNVCRRCALEYFGKHVKFTDFPPYARDIEQAGTFYPAYYQLFLDALANCRAAIVNNDLARQRLEGYCPHVCIVPGGVTVADYEHVPLSERPPRKRAVILMTGRADRPWKGRDVLIAAGEGLAQFRSGFEIWVTDDADPVQKPWYKACGWRSHAGIMSLYQEADIVAAPSTWEEPYGLVAVEAMAAGRPVVASAVGGLKGIVRHGETGFLVEPGSSTALALALDRLLDDPALRSRMGARGREIAEAEYDWQQIIDTHYPPLLERVMA
ncbi:MAG: glycosyltransferase family 4 protein [Candidatus Hydrogenedentota bacterium]